MSPATPSPSGPRRGADVLIIDDDESVRGLLCAVLRREGHAVREAANGAAGLAAVAEQAPDLILCDLNMPEMDGLEVCQRVKGDEATRHIPLVLITGQADHSVRLRGIEVGADDYLTKPMDIAELMARSRSLLRGKRLDDEVRRQRRVIDSMITISTFHPDYAGDTERIQEEFLRRAADLLRAERIAVIGAAPDVKTAPLYAHWPATEADAAAAQRGLAENPGIGEMLRDGTRLEGGGEVAPAVGVPVWDPAGRVIGAVVAFGAAAEVKRESLAILEALALRVGAEIQLRGHSERLEMLVAERTKDLRLALHDLECAKQALERAQEETIFRLALAAEYRDRETANHLRRMARYSELLAEASGLGAEEIALLRYASLMHDIGKIGIPDHVLQKSGPLTAEEYELMKTHTLVGASICDGSDAPLLQMSERVALGHHERWDGSGYPHRRRGEETPIEARIVAVADVFDALTTKRRYKRAWTLEESFAHLEEIAGTHLDPRLVGLFLEIRLPVSQIAQALGDAPGAGEADRIPHALR
ncbi:MAG: response regulator [Candidatus Sumerlaeia bacterium]|nr:response regulator [Candidatus Sumerlaeia bacterium]